MERRAGEAAPLRAVACHDAVALPRSQSSVRVLVVDDEALIRRVMMAGVEGEADLVGVASAAGALARLQTERFDVIVLDVMMPGLDGFTVCERLRSAGRDAPVLILTAKDDEEDVVRGFEAGATDYVTKPFGVRELMARIEALLRRGPRTEPATFSAGPLVVDAGRGEAVAAGEVFELSLREVKILRILAENAGRIVGRRVLLERVWGMNNVALLETRTVDMHIAKLRKKLGHHGEIITTVRGQGYRLCP